MSDLTRPCAVCGVLFTHGNRNYKTCGSPRCVNTQRRNRYAASSKRQVEKARQAKAWKRPQLPKYGEPIADNVTRRRIVSAWRSGDGLDGWDRLTHTALRAKVSVATAISVLRSSGVVA